MRPVALTKGRTKTSRTANNIGFVLKADPSLKGVFASLDACITLWSRAELETAARFFLRLAKQARINRRLEELEAISDWVTARLPDTAFSQIATFHKAHCLHRRGGTVDARRILERAIEVASPAHKPRAILTLAATYLDAGDRAEGTLISLEALWASNGGDTLTELQAQRNLAVTLAIVGDHGTALSRLESLLPTARALGAYYPADLLCHLNSLALELGEVGRVDEANRVIDYVLRSPLAANRPQWHDTKLELASKPSLAFFPFTLALGAPEAENALERQPESLSSSAQTATLAQALPLDGTRSRVPRAQLAFARRLLPFERSALSATVGFASLSRTRRTGLINSVAPPRSATKHEPARSGYAISPPTRAPPPACRRHSESM